MTRFRSMDEKIAKYYWWSSQRNSAIQSGIVDSEEYSEF